MYISAHYVPLILHVQCARDCCDEVLHDQYVESPIHCQIDSDQVSQTTNNWCTKRLTHAEPVAIKALTTLRSISTDTLCLCTNSYSPAEKGYGKLPALVDVNIDILLITSVNNVQTSSSYVSYTLMTQGPC